MREFGIVIACVVGLLVLLSFLGTSFDSSVRRPAHAMELARERAAASAARAEAEQVKAELTKTYTELKAAVEENKKLKKQVEELEAKLTSRK